MALDRLKAKDEEEQIQEEEQEEEVKEPEKEPEPEPEFEKQPEEDFKAIADARLKEIERLKAEKREIRAFAPMPEQDTAYSKAELRVFESLRDDAFQEFLETNPQYKENETTWQKFLSEYQDRVSELEYAKRKKVPVTKRLFKERLESIHKALVGSDVIKEEGKKELLQRQSEAQILGAAANSGNEVEMGKKPERQRILPKPGHGFSDWIPANRQK